MPILAGDANARSPTVGTPPSTVYLATLAARKSGALSVLADALFTNHPEA